MNHLHGEKKTEVEEPERNLKARAHDAEPEMMNGETETPVSDAETEVRHGNRTFKSDRSEDDRRTPSTLWGVLCGQIVSCFCCGLPGARGIWMSRRVIGLTARGRWCAKVVLGSFEGKATSRTIGGRADMGS